MEAVLWGVRGSMPSPSGSNRFYGANTSCVELRLDEDVVLIFDAGTGIRQLGRTLPDKGVCHIFISHGHTDHVQGLCFFAPFFSPHWTVHLYLPDQWRELPYRVFDGSSFPLSFSELSARVVTHTITAGQSLKLAGRPDVRVEGLAARHPGGGMAYRVHKDDAVFVYSGDHEMLPDAATCEMAAAMLSGATVAYVDAAYTRADYIAGRGHSCWEDWLKPAISGGVGTLVLGHHDIDRSDAELDAVQQHLAGQSLGLQVLVAREGMRLPVARTVVHDASPSDWLESFISELSLYREESTLLDRILHKAREITRADAGTFFLAEGDELVFAYAHNNTLFPADAARKSMYVNMRLPISPGSIAGYTAARGETLNLPDVYELPPDVPYTFNRSYDEKSGYRTSSVLTMPLFSRNRELLGVLQLINSLHPRTGQPVPFTKVMEETVRRLAREAAVFLEVSGHVRESIERLLRIAVLHDPTETGPHAQRVGALSAELYQLWAQAKGESVETIRYYRGMLRLAAMLHDIGKVGVSDLVLKKNGKLTDEEYAVMKGHTRLGSALFNADSGLDALAHEISLHHHQKWDGSGYPALDDGARLSGEGIPLSARIAAIADVFDALVSPRSYKEPWTFEQAEAILHKDAGTHFDPELVTFFSSIMDTVRLVYARFPDH